MKIKENVNVFIGYEKYRKKQLQNLIENRVFENKELEYKDYSFINGKIPDKQKDKFIKEVVAFANTNGGIIIIGMQEDENRLPVKLKGAGLSIGEFDNWLSSFRQLVLSRIRPHLHGIECIPIELNESNIAIVVSVPKSYVRPHSFWDGNKDEFFMRYSNGITYMDIDDLRKEFLYTNGIQDKIRQFRRERISLIAANECIGDLGNKAKIVFHIIPEWSFELGNQIDLSKLNNNTRFRPISASGWDYRYNADGYCIFSYERKTNLIKDYTQVFHNGIIEAVEIRLMSENGEKRVYEWSQVQLACIGSLVEYGNIMERLHIPKPWHILATILNAKDYVANFGWEGLSLPIERNLIFSLDGVCTEDIQMKVALKPVFDSLSNAFGFEKSNAFE